MGRIRGAGLHVDVEQSDDGPCRRKLRIFELGLQKPVDLRAFLREDRRGPERRRCETGDERQRDGQRRDQALHASLPGSDRTTLSESNGPRWNNPPFDRAACTSGGILIGAWTARNTLWTYFTVPARRVAKPVCRSTPNQPKRKPGSNAELSLRTTISGRLNRWRA